MHAYIIRVRAAGRAGDSAGRKGNEPWSVSHPVGFLYAISRDRFGGGGLGGNGNYALNLFLT